MKKLLFLTIIAFTSYSMHAMEEMPPQETLNKLLYSENNETAILALYASARNDYFSGNIERARHKLEMCTMQSVYPWVAQEAQEYLQKIEHVKQIEHAKQIELAKSRNQLPPVITIKPPFKHTIKPPFKHFDVQEQLMQRTLDEAADWYYNKKDLAEARKVYRRVLKFTKPGDINIEAQHRYAREQIKIINAKLAQEKAANSKVARNILSNNE